MFAYRSGGAVNSEYKFGWAARWLAICRNVALFSFVAASTPE
jgi:hypothetical protein